MYADYEQVLRKGNLGELVLQNSDQCEFYTEFDSDSLRIQLSILAEFYHSFRQGGGGYTLHNVVDFLNKKRKKIWSPINLVLCPWSMFFWLCLQLMPALNKHSVIYEGWSLSSLHPKEQYLKHVTNDFVDGVEAIIYLWPHFYIAVIDVEEWLWLSL